MVAISSPLAPGSAGGSGSALPDDFCWRTRATHDYIDVMSKRQPTPAKPRTKTNPGRETNAQRLERAARLLKQLKQLYPDAHCALDHRNAFELLAATILSAQCTDVRVNMVTPDLFARYPTPADMAKAAPEDLEALIKSTGFYRNKAKSLRGMAQRLTEHHASQVPDTMDELLELPGVARKTANVVLGNAFGKNLGVVVDTHVGRLSQRLGLTTQSDPVKVEQDLMKLFPQEDWALLSHLLIFHGRQVCNARKPACENCKLAGDCPRVGVE